jgi:hypothetical protein
MRFAFGLDLIVDGLTQALQHHAGEGKRKRRSD